MGHAMLLLKIFAKSCPQLDRHGGWLFVRVDLQLVYPHFWHVSLPCMGLTISLYWRQTHSFQPSDTGSLSLHVGVPTAITQNSIGNLQLMYITVWHMQQFVFVYLTNSLLGHCRFLCQLWTHVASPAQPVYTTTLGQWSH